MLPKSDEWEKCGGCGQWWDGLRMENLIPQQAVTKYERRCPVCLTKEGHKGCRFPFDYEARSHARHA